MKNPKKKKKIHKNPKNPGFFQPWKGFLPTWADPRDATRDTSSWARVSAATSLKCRASKVRGGLPAMRATVFVSTRRETGSKMWVAIGRKSGSLGTFCEVCGEIFFLDENWVLCAWSGSPSCSNQACASKASSLKGEERGVSAEAGPGTTYVFYLKQDFGSALI